MSSESYIKAEIPDEGFILKLSRIGTQMRISLVVLWLLFIELCCAIFNLFVCKKEQKIDGQVCLVTGAANGLGRCIAMEFAKKGCHIAIVDIVDSSETVKEINEKYRVKCEGFQCDISNVAAIEKIKSDIEKNIGPVDILVNNAAMILCDRFQNNTIDQITRCVDVNLTSTIKVNEFFEFDNLFFLFL